MQIAPYFPPLASSLASRTIAQARQSDPLESSPAPAGFEVADAADGSIRPTCTSWIKRRLENNGISLIAIRHGQSQSNADSEVQGKILLYGQSESPLTDKGRGQAHKCAEELVLRMGGDDWLRQCIDKPQTLPVFISSSMGRALESSHIIVDHIKAKVEELGGPEASQRLAPYLEVEAEPRLRETNFGRYEKHPLSEVEDAYPDFIKSWRPPEGMGTDFLHRFPGGESRADLMTRMTSFFDSLVTRYPQRSVVMLSHSECILGGRTALGLAPVNEGKVRAETSTIANATPYWLVGTQPARSSPNFQSGLTIQDF